MMHSKDKKGSGRAGFTLVEVLVVLFLTGVLVPVVMRMYAQAAGVAAAGRRQSEYTRVTRTLQQKFTRYVHRGVKNVKLEGGDTIVRIKMPTGEFARFEYVVDGGYAESSEHANNKLVYYSDESDLSTLEVLAEKVYRDGANEIFDVTSEGLVKCELFIGAESPDNAKKVAGTFIRGGTYFVAAAAPKLPAL